MERDSERIIGVIMYSAISPDYTLRTIVFTDKRLLEIPLSKMSELITKTNELPSVIASLFEAINPAIFSGLGNLVGLKLWKDLKKKTQDKQVVFDLEGDVPSELVKNAVRELEYEKIKWVKLKKVSMSSDAYVGIGAGF